MSGSFSPKDYLELAKQILAFLNTKTYQVDADTIQNAYFRAAISRAYYSVFLYLREHYSKNPKTTFFGRDIHQQVAQKIRNPSTRAQFKSFRIARNQSDYDLPPKYNVTKKEVEHFINLGNKILAKYP